MRLGDDAPEVAAGAAATATATATATAGGSSIDPHAGRALAGAIGREGSAAGVDQAGAAVSGDWL